MRRTAIAGLALAVAGCTGGVEPFAVAVPAGSDCSPVLSPPVLGAGHISAPEVGEYNTDPPTSGRHYSVPGTAPRPAGVYPDQVTDEVQVHNLEHGHVVVQYDRLADDEVSGLSAIVLADPVKVLMAPRPGLPWKLALTAWGAIQVCDEIPDDLEALVRAFVRDHRGAAGIAPEKNLPN